MIRFCALVCILFLVAACGSTPTGVDACPDSGSVSPNYVRGAGDSLQIFVWRHTEITTTVPVRPDGKISIPLVEDMIAVGKTPTSLVRDIELVLAEYLRTPRVNIIVTQQGAANQIQIIGNVSSPQAIPYREGIRLLDAMITVGGLDPFAAGNRATLVRQVNESPVECRIRLKDLLTDGDISQNVALYPGDVIIVPQARF
jgi:polysaccharide export outer membrane protein